MNETYSSSSSSSLNTKVTAFLQSRPVVIQMLRFAAIGALNTALDFIILNYVTKSFDISSGVELGVLNVISFTAAIIQSYFWNRAWAFAENSGVTIYQNAIRLFLVGGLGLAAFIAVFVGAGYDAASAFYLMIFGAFIVLEFVLWKAFKLRFAQQQSAGAQFASFLIVSLIGLVINSVIIVLATHVITPGLQDTINADSIKNVAKILATAFSLIWNFVGYKLFVFKR